MWDDSTLPMYDGSLTSNIILVSLYLRLIVYWLAIILGIITMIALIFSPFVITYFGVKSLKIKVKNHHKTKHKNKRNKERETDQTIGYLSRLEGNVKKKKH